MGSPLNQNGSFPWTLPPLMPHFILPLPEPVPGEFQSVDVFVLPEEDPRISWCILPVVAEITALLIWTSVGDAPSSGFIILVLVRLDSPPPLDDVACQLIHSEYDVSLCELLVGCLRANYWPALCSMWLEDHVTAPITLIRWCGGNGESEVFHGQITLWAGFQCAVLRKNNNSVTT